MMRTVQGLVAKAVKWGVVSALVATIAAAWVARYATGGRGRMPGCMENLVRIDGAKEQWALENNLRPRAASRRVEPTVEDLAPADGKGYLKSFPECPSGFAYTIGALGEDPVCPSGYPGHSLSEVGDAIPWLHETEMEQDAGLRDSDDAGKGKAVEPARAEDSAT